MNSTEQTDLLHYLMQDMIPYIYIYIYFSYHNLSLYQSKITHSEQPTESHRLHQANPADVQRPSKNLEK